MNMLKKANSVLQKAIRLFRKRYKYFKIPVFWGTLRRLEPVSKVFGYDRGVQSIARYYIDNFYLKNKSDIWGRVLEIGDDTYTARLGYNISQSHVLHVQVGNEKATIVADLTTDRTIPDESFDCIILPQTLQFIYDMSAAIENSYRILKPKGVLLATFSGISQISRYDMDRWGDYWRITSKTAHILFSKCFSVDNVTVEHYGNVLSATGFLQGLASNELSNMELDFIDPDYEVIITVRVVK